MEMGMGGEGEEPVLPPLGQSRVGHRPVGKRAVRGGRAGGKRRAAGRPERPAGDASAIYRRDPTLNATFASPSFNAGGFQPGPAFKTRREE